MTDDEYTHDELIEQAEAVVEAVRATMYYPVANGEAERLQQMIDANRGDTDYD